MHYLPRCFFFRSIWIMREKELLQEISGMGELGGEWRNKQMDLLDKHLKLLKDYSQSKQNLQQYNQGFFKPSNKKHEESLEFAPVNLHLQRMWAHNDTLKRSGVLDVITVGAFARHSGKTKTGGLIRLLHQMKESPLKREETLHKVEAANDAVQAIKQLRKEIVEIMSQLLFLAKTKNPKGMLPLCNEMVTKTRSLLNIWEPNLVEEAFEFIEKNRIIDEPDNNLSPGDAFSSIPMSPFKKITQQLGALDLKSPDLEDFATPMGPQPDLWPQSKPNRFNNNFKAKSPSSMDLNALSTVHNTVKTYNINNNDELLDTNELMSCSLPVACNYGPDATFRKKFPREANMQFTETHFDVNGEVSLASSSTTKHSSSTNQSNNSLNINDVLENKNGLLSSLYDENGYLMENTAIVLGQNGAFLDTKTMSSCPSANYYRPTEEPEPLDLTQLNIEASVMCLVSKVKFLCGRCGSPAVRLRQPKSSSARGGVGFNTIQPDVVTSQPNSNTENLIQSNVNCDHNETISLNNKTGTISSKDLNLALTQAVGEVTRKVKKGNKFTDGLDLSLTTDWASELRPSMKKLRQAMDGLLKTARLMHSVQRLQQDMKKTSGILSVMYRRDVCFSQAVSFAVALFLLIFFNC